MESYLETLEFIRATENISNFNVIVIQIKRPIIHFTHYKEE